LKNRKKSKKLRLKEKKMEKLLSNALLRFSRLAQGMPRNSLNNRKTNISKKEDKLKKIMTKRNIRK
jgi:hypothetical protein